MNIEVNNKSYNIPETSTLTDLLKILETKPMGVAFAINNKVVKKVDWDNFLLTDGMKITMIKAVCGG